MRDFRFRKWCLALVVALLCGVAIGAYASGGKTEVVADEAAGVVRVMVRGKEVAHFDERGLWLVNGTGYYYLPGLPDGLSEDVGRAPESADKQPRQ